VSAQRPSPEADASRSRLAAGYFVAALLVAATVTAIAVAVTGGDEEETSTPSDSAFAPVYDGLEERRVDAGVPTMAEGGGEHFHPILEVYVRGEQIPVPVNIGIDPAQPPEMMAGLHTHDTSGTIHNEAGTGSTLGQFFAVWGIPFSPTQLGPNEANGEQRIRMWVDGEPSDAYGDLELADGQQVVVAYGTEDQLPDGLAP
jgi:hypothetical protein